MDSQSFIEKCIKKYGNYFDYSKVEYKGSKEKLCIICPKHGEFWVSATNFLTRGRCPKCGRENGVKKTIHTTTEFISKARKVHGDKYDYSKVDYVNAHTKVCIICPTHGEFWQSPTHHLDGNGCPKCNGKQKLTTDEFIFKARKVHGDKYDYSKVNYVNATEKVCIVCPIHGEFWQRANDHLQGKSCSRCANDKLKANRTCTIDEFIFKARKVHGDKYNYSKIDYINNSTKVCIICPIHGEFWQEPNNHLRGQGCPKCAIEKKSLTTELFIEKARQVHGDKYDYSKANYVNATEKVCIVCPTHGEFWQSPNNHLQGRGCLKCVGKDKTSGEFIKEAKTIHGDKYDYSKVDYVNAHTKVCIICPIHGEFWQTPNKHLQGRGCLKCKQSHLEEKINLWLTTNHIDFIQEKRINKQRLDFYLPKYNIAIECQGRQHFDKSEWFGNKDKDKAFKESIERDKRKYDYCINKGITLIYILPLFIKKEDIIENSKYEFIYNVSNIFYDIEDFFMKKFGFYKNN